MTLPKGVFNGECVGSPNLGQRCLRDLRFGSFIKGVIRSSARVDSTFIHVCSLLVGDWVQGAFFGHDIGRVQVKMPTT
jgi:hypothetical protein